MHHPKGLYLFKNSISTSDRIEVPSGETVTIQAQDPQNTPLVYTGDNSAFFTATSAGRLLFNGIEIILSGLNAEFLISTGTSKLSILNTGVEFTGTGTKKLGTITADSFSMFNASFSGCSLGFTLNIANFVTLDSVLISTDGLGSDTMIDIQSLTSGTGTIRTFTSVYAIGASEFLINVDSGITIPVSIIGSIDLLGTGTFYAAGSLDSSSLNVSAFSNVGVPDSRAIGGWYSNVLGADTPIADGTYGPLVIDTGLVIDEEERFTYPGATESELVYDGLNPRTVTLMANITAIRPGGGTGDYNFRYTIDRGAGFVALPTPIVWSTFFTATSRQLTMSQEVIVDTGDIIRIEAEGNGNADDIELSGTMNITD